MSRHTRRGKQPHSRRKRRGAKVIVAHSVSSGTYVPRGSLDNLLAWAEEALQEPMLHDMAAGEEFFPATPPHLDALDVMYE